MLTTLFNLFQVLIGFTFIIVIHELGHFLAARWAGVRVLAFAVGFGPALCSYRRGLGWRRGSSEPEYDALAKQNQVADISPTEYRFNMLPLGGYVKMLGQDDTDPAAISDAPDSYQNCPIPKRMVIISAGVVANVILAAAIFCGVFLVGLRAEAPIIGVVLYDSPASGVFPANHSEINPSGITEPGLQPGDRVLSIDGEPIRKFLDIAQTVAMSEAGKELGILVDRPGISKQLLFKITPKSDPDLKLLQLGVGPARSTILVQADSTKERQIFDKTFQFLGLEGIQPGMRIAKVNGRDAQTYADVIQAIRSSQGRGCNLTLIAPNTALSREIHIDADIDLQISRVKLSNDKNAMLPHLLGLTPVMSVERVNDDCTAALKPGDIFSQIGSIRFPSHVDGIRQIRAAKGEKIHIRVLRKSPVASEQSQPSTPQNQYQEIDLGEIPVRKKDGGTIGFFPGDSRSILPIIGSWLADSDSQETLSQSPLRQLFAPGTRIVSINSEPITKFSDIRRILLAPFFTNADPQTQSNPADQPTKVDVQSFEFKVELPTGSIETVSIRLNAAQVQAARWLSWTPRFPDGMLEPEYTLLKEKNPIDSVVAGVRETHSVMLSTYLTFLRLFQGSVKVESLKGPIGIAHIGTLISERGFIWLMFFLGLISVNLAVVNFLPIPITDGGHIVFLVYEAVTGKPPPIAVQNAAMFIGLVLMGTMFLLVSYNDIMQMLR